MCKRSLVTVGLCCCVSILGWSQYSEAGIGRPGKVTICHRADDGKYLQITVATRALPAHQKHGDCVVDDGVPCTVDSCDVNLGCVHAPDDSLCDDGDACTIDTCDPSPGSAGCRNTDIPTCGACCLPDGSCVDRSTAAECTAQGVSTKDRGRNV